MPTSEDIVRQMMPFRDPHERIKNRGFWRKAEELGNTLFPKNNQATAAIAYALEVTGEFGYNLVRPELLFYGIAQEGTNIVASLLNEKHIKMPVIKAMYDKQYERPIDPKPGIEFTDKVWELYTQARSIAKDHADVVVGTEHLMLALLTDPPIKLREIFHCLEINAQEFQREIMELVYPDSEFRKQNAKQIAETARVNAVLAGNERGTVLISQVAEHAGQDLEIPNEIIACCYGVQEKGKVSLKKFKEMLEFFTKKHK